MQVEETGYLLVRIDTDPGGDGFCFCTPTNHPEDIARGLVDGQWADNNQTFGQVFPRETTRIRALEAQIAELRKLLRQCRDDTIGPLVAGGDGGTYVVRHLSPTTINAITSALQNKDATTTPKFTHGDRVTKTKGSSWTGLVVGTYRTSLTPEGYAVESENEPGSVQIYPASALERIDK